MKPLFPKWMNIIPTVGAVASFGGLLTVIAGTWYYATPDYWEVGYMPVQPGEGFNHQLHAGQLGIDCRYCHTNVEESPHSNVPAVSTCYGCHAETRLAGSEFHRVEFIREAYGNNETIEWRRVHKLPDYVRNFPHHVHVNAGVSCYSCHGQIVGMPIVYQHESLSMGWCLECHREPEKYMVPPEQITQLVWVEDEWMSQPVGDRVHEGVTAADLLQSLHDAPPQNCGACHH
ncbi:MAG: cytochrome c3 family protein [Planctomycetota bacterium]